MNSYKNAKNLPLSLVVRYTFELLCIAHDLILKPFGFVNI